MDIVNNDVAVVIPIYKPTLTNYELIALTQCCRILGEHPIFLITFEDLDSSQYQIIFKQEGANYADIKYYDPAYFANLKGYNRLMLSKDFYDSFSDFKYILIYQLDCFVFRNELKKWCTLGFDYIGAPWLKGFVTSNENAPYLGIGNGGFSLRKVTTFRKILASDQKIIDLIDLPRIMALFPESKVIGVLKFLKAYFIGNNAHFEKNKFPFNEDYFWGVFAQKLFSDFKLACITEALAFSFEVQPSRMFQDNNFKLPFGCHAWWKYDLDFWKPYIEAHGYIISEKNAP